MTLRTDEARTTVVRSFLIADIRGYTTFTRTHGDEAAGRLAATFASLARLAVTARNGQVLELRGDEVLAVFDDPAQAVRAAVELQAICREDADQSPGFGFPVGIGLDCGEVVPVEDGFRGAAINLAARLCSKAQAGEVLGTRKLIDLTGDIDIASIEARAAVEVKGYPDPVPIAALNLTESTAAPAVGRPAQLPVELDSYVPHVGRETELTWLLGTWRQACRGHGRVVVVSGPAGIGKTRLVAELAGRSGAEQVIYAGGGGAGAAATAAAVHAAWNGTATTLVVLDDLHLYPTALTQLLDAVDAIETHPALVVAVVRSISGHPLLDELVSRVDRRGDGHRELGPLSPAEMRELVSLYAADEIDDAPLESMSRASGGVPARLHEIAGDWARDEARRRLAAATEWIAGGRAQQSSGLDFANNVIALRLARMFAAHTDPTVDVCPYKGLAPFESSDAPYFYGRERLVGDLAARSVGAGLLAVMGPSGSGKSSVVMAGLLPSLAGGLLPGSDRWTQVVMRPGAHPLSELSNALPAQPVERLLLVVDQLEEVFTTCQDESERIAFIARLVELARDPDRALVVLTVRADYTGHCTPYGELSQLIGDNLVLVGPMNADELRRVIELPARRVGLRVESSLVDALVAEVGDEPGGLPLLSTALVELWQQRQDGWLRYDSYQSTGGVRGAVARLAEASYAELSADEQQVARSLLLRLIGDGEGDAAVRRRAPLAEFDDDPAVGSVLGRLTQDRLLIRDDDRVEIAHEALIREWPRLRGWLEEDATGRQLRRHVTQAAKTWQERGEDDADLYRGARLSATLDWSASHLAELNQLERDFLERSRLASVREADKQRRTNRRLRGLLAGTAVFLVLALVAGVLAVVQRGHARAAQRHAESEALTSDAERLGSAALVDKNLDTALLTAVAGIRLDNRPETQSDLFATLERDPAITRFFHPSQGSVDGIAVAPDQSVLAVGSSGGEIRFYNPKTWAELGKPVELHESVLHRGMAMTPDGRTLIVGADDLLTHGDVFLIDTRSHQIVAHLRWHPHKSFAYPEIAVSPDGKTLGVGLTIPAWHPGGVPVIRLLLYSLPSLRPMRAIRYPKRDVGDELQMAFLGDHRFVTSMDWPRGAGGGSERPGHHRTVVWNVRTGRSLATWGIGGVIATSPDGDTIAVGTNDSDVHSHGRLFLMSARSRAQRLLREAFNPQAIYALAFTPDGKELLAGSADSRIRVWDIAAGKVTTTLAGNTGWVDDIQVSGDGSAAYSGGFDGALIGWDLDGHARLGRTLTWGTPITACAMTPCMSLNRTGTVLATPEMQTAKLVFIDPRSFRTAGSLQTHDGPPMANVAFSPAGEVMADTGGIGSVVLRNANSHAVEARLAVPGYGEFLGFSPDGRTLAVVSGEVKSPTTVLTLWNVASRRLIRSQKLPGSPANMVYSPDGRTVAVATARTSSRGLDIVDVKTGRLLPKPAFSQTPSGLAYSPDGGTLAIGLYDGRVLFWNVHTNHVKGSPLTAAGSSVDDLAYSPDGRLLAVAAADATESLWDLRTRTRIGDSLPSPSGQTGALSFLPNGNLVVLYNGNGVEWTMGVRNWINYACSVAGRDMTRSEWHDLLPKRPYRSVCPTSS